MTNNYNRFNEWLGLASNNIDKVIKFYKINEYSACVFRIQLSTEQLQKALIFLLGLQFRKTHEPSKILEAIENNSIIQIEKKNLNQIKKLTTIAREIEKEETATRYGIVIDGKLISPDDYYDKDKTDTFINKLKEIIIIFRELLKEIPDLEQEIKHLHKFIKKIEELD